MVAIRGRPGAEDVTRCLVGGVVVPGVSTGEAFRADAILIVLCVRKW
jgi:hypothetical protein